MVKDARVSRITHLIQEYNVDKTIHIKGHDNCFPDFLSRSSREQDKDLFDVEYGLATKGTLLSSTSKYDDNNSISSTTPLTEQHVLATMTLRPHKNRQQFAKTSNVLENSIVVDNNLHNKSTHNSSSNNPVISKFSHNFFDTTKIKFEQARDPNIQNIIKQLNLRSNGLPFVLKDDILYKLFTLHKNSTHNLKVIYLPSSMIYSLLRACHDDPSTGARFSTEQTYYEIRNHYWWPRMKHTIQRYIKFCLLCQQYNTSRQKKCGKLNPISQPGGSFDLIGIDYCGPLKRTPSENQYVLVITDYFTRHIIATALTNCTAETTAQALFNEFFCKYDILSTILSDQGPHFNNQLMHNIQKLIAYNHISSTPYHPQTNGVVERFNSTFIPQISKLQDTQNNNWDEYLQAVVFTYNSSIRKPTKYSPYELLYGRPPRLPFHIRPTHFLFHKPNDYFEQLQETVNLSLSVQK